MKRIDNDRSGSRDGLPCSVLVGLDGLGDAIPVAGKAFPIGKRSLFDHLESPGTKAYSLREARNMLERNFANVRLATRLNPGDLLLIQPSEKYVHPLYCLLFRIYPRWLVRWLGDRFGLNLLIEAHRPRPG